VNPLGRTLIIVGLVIAAVGLAITFAGKPPFGLGRLPGDLEFRGRNWTVSFPIATSLILSLVLTLVLWLFNRR
jgi:hypothetical protein